jgi:hypothetical protein
LVAQAVTLAANSVVISSLLNDGLELVGLCMVCPSGLCFFLSSFGLHGGNDGFGLAGLGQFHACPKAAPRAQGGKKQGD